MQRPIDAIDLQYMDTSKFNHEFTAHKQLIYEFAVLNSDLDNA